MHKYVTRVGLGVVGAFAIAVAWSKVKSFNYNRKCHDLETSVIAKAKGDDDRISNEEGKDLFGKIGIHESRFDESYGDLDFYSGSHVTETVRVQFLHAPPEMGIYDIERHMFRLPVGEVSYSKLEEYISFK